jgi:hypothetical protein
MGLVERLVDRLVRVEDGLIDVRNQLEATERGVAGQFERLEADVVSALQPMLLRRHDDVVLLQGTLIGVAEDLQALRSDFDKRFANGSPEVAARPDLAGALNESSVLPHQPGRHPAHDFARPSFEAELPMVDEAEPRAVEDAAEPDDEPVAAPEEDDAREVAAVFHLPPDYFEERGSAAHRVEPRQRPPEGDAEGGRHEVREQRAQH